MKRLSPPSVLSGIFTDVEASLKEIGSVLDEDEAAERKLDEVIGGSSSSAATAAAVLEIRRDLEKYMEAHEKASFTNTELHRAMNLHISNLRLLGGPLDALKDALPRPQLSEGAYLRYHGCTSVTSRSSFIHQNHYHVKASVISFKSGS